MEEAVRGNRVERARFRIASPATAILVAIVILEIVLVAVGSRVEAPLLSVALTFAIAFFLLAFRSPDIAWAVVWVVFPFSMEAPLPGGAAIQLPTEPMIALALLAWGFRAMLDGWKVPDSPLHLPLAALALVALLSALIGHYPILGIKALLVAAGYAAFGYLYFLTAPCTPQRQARWARLVVISAAFWGLYGILHSLLTGITARAAYGSARPFFPEHGTYSAFLSMTLPLSVLLTMERRGRARWGYGLATACIAIGILLSFTRAAWVSVAVVIPVTLLLWRGRRGLRGLLVPAGSILAALGLLAGTGLVHKIERHAESIVDTENVSNLERLNRWIAAGEMAKDRPWLGVGYGAFASSYPQYRRKLVITELAYQRMGVHSEPLRLLSEMGWIGFTAALWFLAAAARAGMRGVGSGDRLSRLMALGVLAGLATYAVHGIFNTYLATDKIAVPFWTGLGVLAALDPRRVRREVG